MRLGDAVVLVAAWTLPINQMRKCHDSVALRPQSNTFMLSEVSGVRVTTIINHTVSQSYENKNCFRHRYLYSQQS